MGGKAPPRPHRPRPRPSRYILSGAQSDDHWGAVARESMSGIRKKTVEHLTQSWNTIPHATHFEKADMTALEQLRKQYTQGIKEDGGSLAVTVFILKVITETLRRFPRFNASIDVENQKVIQKQYYHIGVAVDMPSGLLVPAIRDVDKKTLQHGGAGFKPIVDSPEVAILGVSSATTEGVFQNGQIVPRTMLPLSLSYDHRLIDGADAARFMHWVTVTLDNPWNLMLES